MDKKHTYNGKRCGCGNVHQDKTGKNNIMNNPKVCRKHLKSVRTEEYRKCMSKKNKGKKKPKGFGYRIWKSRDVNDPTDRKRTSKRMEKLWEDKEFRKERIQWGIENGGKICVMKQPKYRLQHSLAMKGKRHTEEQKKKVSISVKRAYETGLHTRKVTKKTRKKMSDTRRRLFEDPKFAEKTLGYLTRGQKARPTKPEKELTVLIKSLNSDWKYTGNGTFWVGRRNPDIVNCNGQKKVIELFGNWWHGFEFTGRTKRQEENRCLKDYDKYGFKCLIVWERELKNKEKLIPKIKNFIRGGNH